MSDFAVEINGVSKIFYSGRNVQSEDVYALKETNLGIASGEFFTLLGPSGCGKTTTLRLIAGFEIPTSGEISIQGKPMGRIPPNHRPVNTVFQNYALFPHLNVARNVAFGLEVKRVPRAEREQRVRDALELVRLADMGIRKPSQLSGGQQQRVALARALVNQPAVLLLDEPLGALDLKLRKAMQIELKQLQAQVGITFIYVTHDQEEALTMSDRIAVMNQGEILQVGDPVSLYEKPATRFVADFIGESNFIKGKVDSIADGNAWLVVGEKKVKASSGDMALTPGQEVVFTIRPEKIQLAARDSAVGDSLEGFIDEVVYIGTDTRYIVSLRSNQSIVIRIQNGRGSVLGQFRKTDPVKIGWIAEDARILTG